MRKLRIFLMPYIFSMYKVIFYIFRLLPVRNKVVATTMRGRKYADNPRAIVEALHAINSEVEIIWFVDERYDYETPDWIKRVPYYGCGMLRRIYEMATAKVWINSHFYEVFVQKKKNQLFIQTWHGSIALKKINKDMRGWDDSSHSAQEMDNTVRMTDVFVSNSDFTNELYRRAFGYNGQICKCGCPRNDELVAPKKDYKELVQRELGIEGKNIFLYAPTFRDDFEKSHVMDYSPYEIDFEGVHKVLQEKFSGKWTILVKFHPVMQRFIDEEKYFHYDFVKNVTSYNNMQALLSASDLVLTDYSSLIFDAAIAGKSGFTICLDYEKYKGQRDLYFDMKDLPFPFATSNLMLIDNIWNFNKSNYDEDWNKFATKMGLYESGHSSELIGQEILKYIDGNTKTFSI